MDRANRNLATEILGSRDENWSRLLPRMLLVIGLMVVSVMEIGIKRRLLLSSYGYMNMVRLIGC